MGSSTQRINGQSFDFTLGGTDIHAEKFSLDITDNTAVAKKGGRPDGWLQGDVEASGEMTLDHVEFKKLVEIAKKAGSWQAVEPFDLVSYAKVGDDEFKVEAFGCKVKINKLLDVDKGSVDKTAISIPFMVTGSDFVNVDSVPYIAAATTTKK